MEGLLVGNLGNTPHVTALLTRFTVYGYLMSYPLQAIMEGIETAKSESYLLFFTDRMDWPTFVHYLEVLAMQEFDPMPGLDEMLFVFMRPDETKAVYNFASLKQRINAGGRFDGTP